MFNTVDVQIRSLLCRCRCCLYRHTQKKVPFLFSNLYITCKREKLPVTFGQSSCSACAFPSSVSGGDANVPLFLSFFFYLNITFYESLTVPFLAQRGQKWR